MSPNARARRRLAGRTIPVVVVVPTQLVLGLPLGMSAVEREAIEPDPEAPVLARRKAAA